MKIPRSPATPPYKRVRIRRFEEIRLLNFRTDLDFQGIYAAMETDEPSTTNSIAQSGFITTDRGTIAYDMHQFGSCPRIWHIANLRNAVKGVFNSILSNISDL